MHYYYFLKLLLKYAIKVLLQKFLKIAGDQEKVGPQGPGHAEKVGRRTVRGVLEGILHKHQAGSHGGPQQQNETRQAAQVRLFDVS